VVGSGLERPLLNRSSATLSRGMLQRIAVIEAVQAESSLLLLGRAVPRRPLWQPDVREIRRSRN